MYVHAKPARQSLGTAEVTGPDRAAWAALGPSNVLVSFETEWAWPTYRPVRVVAIVFAAIVAYPCIPASQTSAFKGISIFLGLVLSVGSTSAISNVIAGYSLVYRRAFRIGDRVRIGEHVGDAIERGLLVTLLRTPKNEDVVIPNSAILNGDVVNYSTMARARAS